MVAMLATTGVVNAKNAEKKGEAEAVVAKAETTTANSKELSLINSELAIFHLDNVITVSYINTNQTPTEFTITDEYGNDLYSKSTRHNSLVHYRLRTEQLPEGKYFATLQVGKEKYTKEFAINL